MIAEKVIDRRLELTAPDPERSESRSRMRAATSLMMYDKGLSTDIAWKDIDSLSRSLSNRDRSHLHRIRRWQKRLRAINAVERNLLNAFVTLDRVCSNLKLPHDVRQEACVIYRKIVMLGLVRGRTIEGMVCASIYAATRVVGMPRSLDEVARVSGRERKELGRDYKIITKWLRLGLPPTDPRNYVSRFCSELGIDISVERKALEMLNSTVDDPEMAGVRVAGKDPTGVAAAAIYLASMVCGKKTTQARLSKIAGITEVTLRNRFKELVNLPGSPLRMEFPEEHGPPYARIHAATFDSYLRKTSRRRKESGWNGEGQVPGKQETPGQG